MRSERPSPAAVAQVSKPAVSPARRSHGVGGPISKSAAREQPDSPRVWQPAIPACAEATAGRQQIGPSSLRFDATLPKPEAKAGKSALQSRSALAFVFAALLGGFDVLGNTPTEAAPPVAATLPAPVTITYAIQRYEIAGGPPLDQDTIDRVTARATGPAVSLPQIRRALVNLQQAYRDQGHRQVALQLPRQSLTNGVVNIHVIERPPTTQQTWKPQEQPAPAPVAQVSQPAVSPASKPAAGEPPEDRAALSAWTAPTYDVRHFEVRGNTVLPIEEIDRILSPAAGPQVSLDQLQKALNQLQSAYHERGYTRASVQLPQQLVTDGTLSIRVDEGRSPEDYAASLEALKFSPAPPQPAATGPTFEVRQYEIAGNTLLRTDVMEPIFATATGPEVSLAQIQKALGELQLAYRERGFATVSVSLPQQQLTNAIVKVQVTEGSLADVQVVGNRYFSSNNVMRALPTARDATHWNDTPFNSSVFQRELDLANQNRDRTIYSTIGPGPEPGTSALTLRVKDRLPLHGRLDLNNHSTPGTPDWRVNASAQYNNLWQLEHQLGLSYGFTPEAFKAGGLMTDYFFNRPLISYPGVYYRLPFGAAESVAQRIGASSAFGYDEATRQFRLPPAGVRPDITFYASTSSSDTGVQYGPAVLVSQTPLLTIVSQDSGENLSINDSLGARVSVPRAVTDTRRWSFSGGVDWKRYDLDSYNTNNFIITTVVTNSQGSQTIVSRVSSPQPVRRNQVQYVPFTLAADYSQTDRGGTLNANLTASANFFGDDEDFGALAYTRDAKAAYGKAFLSVTRDQKVFNNWSLLLRGIGQAATGPLISNEQFALGGVNSVRGYYEGDQYADAGVFVSGELRTPFIQARAPGWSGDWPVWLRGSVFMDYGRGFLMDAPPGVDRGFSLWGAGFGISANVNNAVDVRVVVGWPLIETPNTSVNDPRVQVSLGGQF